MSNLLKVKICIETEIVGENVYESTNFDKTGRELFQANRNEIIDQAMELGEVTITAEKIDKSSQLPKGWTENSLPWAFAVFGSKRQDLKIKEFFEDKPQNEKI